MRAVGALDDAAAGAGPRAPPAHPRDPAHLALLAIAGALPRAAGVALPVVSRAPDPPAVEAGGGSAGGAHAEPAEVAGLRLAARQASALPAESVGASEGGTRAAQRAGSALLVRVGEVFRRRGGLGRHGHAAGESCSFLYTVNTTVNKSITFDENWPFD